MANLLDNLRDRLSGKPPNKAKNAVSVYSTGALGKPMPQQRFAPPQNSAHVPNAAAIYAAAAAVFAVITIYYLFKGHWVTGLIMVVPTCCLGGFAWYYLKP